jgi:hypothetical protein
MSIITTFRSGDAVLSGSPAGIAAVIDVCSAGTVGQWYTFHPGDTITDQIGGGRGSDIVLALLANGASVVYFTPATPTWGALPTVVHVGTGPAITVALAGGASGPFDDHTIVGTVKAGGAGPTATIAWAYDGSTQIETTPVPAESPAIVTGTVDLNVQVYPWNVLNAETIIYTAPAAKTLTFAAAPTSPADVITKLNALAVAAPLAVTFALSQDSAGHGFVQQTSTATGAAAAITMSGGTALGALGLTAATTNGLAATDAPPWTGLVRTYPATSSYVVGDTYTIACTGPSASILAITNAMAVGRAQWKNTPFGFFVIPQTSSTGANAAALQSAVTTALNPWRIDGSCQVWALIASSLHVASAVAATNAANITTADNALLLGFASNAAALDVVAPADCYVAGSTQLRPGSFRRSAVVAGAIKRATLAKLGSDLGEGIVQGVTLKGPDGLTLARDESSATVKLGPGAAGASGPGFAVLKSTAAGPAFPKFLAGVTRAGSTSRFRFSYVVVVALQMAQTLFARATGWEGQTWPTNPATGKIRDSEAIQRADDAYNDLVPFLLPDGKDPSVSSFAVAIDNSTVFVNNSTVPLNASFVTLGIVLEVDITVTALGTAVQSLTP